MKITACFFVPACVFFFYPGNGLLKCALVFHWLKIFGFMFTNNKKICILFFCLLFFLVFFYKGCKCGKLHLELLVLLSWFVEVWSRRGAATSAVGDDTESPKGHAKKKRHTGVRSGRQDQSILYDEKVPSCWLIFSDEQKAWSPPPINPHPTPHVPSGLHICSTVKLKQSRKTHCTPHWPRSPRSPPSVACRVSRRLETVSRIAHENESPSRRTRCMETMWSTLTSYRWRHLIPKARGEMSWTVVNFLPLISLFEVYYKTWCINEKKKKLIQKVPLTQSHNLSTIKTTSFKLLLSSRV